MKIGQCQLLLSTELSRITVASREGTVLGRTAESVLLMVRSYESDGRIFTAAGDQVNALASCWYAFGWLHCGSVSGLLSTMKFSACPFAGSCETLPESHQFRLQEKTSRYACLLDAARNSVSPAPEPSTPAHDFANRILVVATVYATHGRKWAANDSQESALACFSYGHGWIDAGVRAGLFRITANRDLFCE
jgi:hypothetical protein